MKSNILTNEKTLKKFQYIYIFIMYLLIFQPLLQNYISVFQYTDEAFAVCIVPILAICCISNRNNLKIKKYDLIIVACLIIIFCIGIYSNIVYEYQNIKYVISDIILVYKFFMVYYISTILFKNKFGTDNIITKHIKFLIFIMFIGTIYDYVFKVNLSSDIRFGIRGNMFIYEHPTVLAAMGIFLLASLIRFSTGKNYIYIFMISLVICSTLRTKAIVACIIFFMVYVYIIKMNKKLDMLKITILGVICIAIASQQIVYYFIENDNTARPALTRTAIKIANDYFPVGTGFGTFGSYFSGVSYSPLYYMYGINDAYGLVKGKTFFLSDNFFPLLLGQFGYIGTILYIICIIIIFMKIQKEYNKENKIQYMSRMICLLYLLISSTSESAFVNSFAMPLALLIAI